MPREKLTCESSMYWQELCCYVSQAGPEYEAQLDTVLPDCLQFCSYFGSYVSYSCHGAADSSVVCYVIPCWCVEHVTSACITACHDGYDSRILRCFARHVVGVNKYMLHVKK